MHPFDVTLTEELPPAIPKLLELVPIECVISVLDVLYADPHDSGCEATSENVAGIDCPAISGVFCR